MTKAEEFRDACATLSEELSYVLDQTDNHHSNWHDAARRSLARMRVKLAAIEKVVQDVAAESWKRP